MLIGLLKRFAPFFIALALGLFVASFFVTLAAPRWPLKRSRPMRPCQELQYLRYEKQRLEAENDRLKAVNAENQIKLSTREDGDFNKLVPPPPPTAVKRTR